jgi:putative addiction module killer protein
MIINFDNIKCEDILNYKVVIYKSTTGQSPFDSWLDDLDKAVAARIDARILRFEMGLLGDVKKLKGVDIYEARFDMGPGYRLYFGIVRRELILLILLGGDKRSQSRDIAEAQRLWEQYLEEYHGSNK